MEHENWQKISYKQYPQYLNKWKMSASGYVPSTYSFMDKEVNN